MGKSVSTDTKADGSAKTKKPAVKKAAAPKAKTTKAAVAGKAVKKTVVKKTPPAPLAPPAAPSYDDIALRAYFISEKRQQLGLPGDSSEDWVEAERQLVEEAKSKRPAKKKKS